MSDIETLDETIERFRITTGLGSLPQILMDIYDSGAIGTEGKRYALKLSSLKFEQLEAENQKLRDTNQRLRERIDQLETPQWYWDDRCLDSAIEPHEIGDYDDVGDIIELRPIHELPKVFVLITHTGPRLFDSREAAESEVSDE